MPRIIGKQAPHKGAFSFGHATAFLWLVAIATGALAEPCQAPVIEERARVVAVFDGDTVKLQDGRRVRFLGINTPEVGKNNKPAQPFADTARQRLTRLISAAPEVGLSFGPQREDHYGRLLAYVFGKDGLDLQRVLLREGLAAAITVPPNVAHAECYLEDERKARQARLGMWSGGDYLPVTPTSLPANAGGFVYLKGKIERVGKSRKSVWLNLSQRVALRVARDDMAYFTHYRPEQLQGRTVIARGWLSRYKDQQIIRVRHPASLELLD